MEERRAASNRCLITYGSSGTSITHFMCKQHGSIDVDECYTLTQRDLKYTLLHMRSRVVRSTVASMITRLDEAHGIKCLNVFGYNGVSIGSEIDDHPGMMLIADNMKRETQSLECWIESGDSRQYRRGLLYYCLPGFEVKEMSRLQLLNHIKELNAKIDEDRATIAAMELAVLETEQLRNLVERQQRRIGVYERMFARRGREDEILPPSP